MRRLLIVAAAVLALGACSGGEAAVAPSSTSTTDETTTTTTEESTTTTSSAGATTTATTAAPCPPERPANAEPGSEVTRLDLDADGVDERWAVIGSGASVQIYGLFVVDGCELVPVTIAGLPTELAVGGTVGNQAGVFCTDSGAVVTVSASSDDGLSYTGVRTDYRLTDGALVEEATAPFELDSDDPTFPDLSAFRC